MTPEEKTELSARLAHQLGRANRRLANVRTQTQLHPEAVPTVLILAALDGPLHPERTNA